MNKCVVLILAAAVIFNVWGSGNAATIGFDDIVGMIGPWHQGQPVPAKYMIDDEYLSQGVLFKTRGGGLRVARTGNSISSPNMVAGTGPGPVLDYYAPVYANFWEGPTPAVVDMAGLTLSNTSRSGSLAAYDLNGSVLGSVSGGASATLSLTFPGQIRSVIFYPRNAVFDNFTFDGLCAVPIPGAVWLLGSGLFGIIGIRRKPKQ